MGASSRPVRNLTLRVAFDQAASKTLRAVLLNHPDLFAETEPQDADVIIYDTDDVHYIGQSEVHRRYPHKGVCVSETDIPTFRLPGLYAANMRGMLAGARTRTISYFISQIDRPNPEVAIAAQADNPRRYLYSFMGGSNSWPRKRLFRLTNTRPDVVIEATDSYNHWQNEGDKDEAKRCQMRRYAQVLASSKFALCPRGCGLSSYRLFEAMSLGVAPVVISDRWQPIDGIDWRFAIFLRERDIPDVDRILRAGESEWRARGDAAREAYRAYLAPDNVAYLLHRQIGDVLASYDPRRERVLAAWSRLRVANRAAFWATHFRVKYVVLKAFYHTGIPFPVTLHRSVEEQIELYRKLRTQA